VTRHVLVGFSAPAVQSLPPAAQHLAAERLLTRAPRVAQNAGDGVMPMQWAATFVVALAIMILAAVGAALIHYNFLWTDSLGIGMGVFVLVGGFMLYGIFFWHE
jgi:hypothetical protein